MGDLDVRLALPLALVSGEGERPTAPGPRFAGGLAALRGQLFFDVCVMNAASCGSTFVPLQAPALSYARERTP